MEIIIVIVVISVLVAAAMSEDNCLRPILGVVIIVCMILILVGQCAG